MVVDFDNTELKWLRDGNGCGDVVRAGFLHGRPMQICYEMPEGALLDVAFFHRGIEEGRVVNVHANGRMGYPEGMLDVERRDWSWSWRGDLHSDMPLPMPKDPERYLEYHYGKDWRTPQNDKGLFKGDQNALRGGGDRETDEEGAG